HHVGRAETHRELELPGDGVDGDDAPGARDATALDDRESDATAADDGRGPSGVHPRRVEDGAKAGRDAAADQRHAVERDVGTDAYERVLVYQHALGEGAQMHELRDPLAVLREAGPLVRAAHG